MCWGVYEPLPPHVSSSCKGLSPKAYAHRGRLTRVLTCTHLRRGVYEPLPPHVSGSCKDLIKGMLTVDASLRCAAAAARHAAECGKHSPHKFARTRLHEAAPCRIALGRNLRHPSLMLTWTRFHRHPHMHNAFMPQGCIREHTHTCPCACLCLAAPRRTTPHTALLRRTPDPVCSAAPHTRPDALCFTLQDHAGPDTEAPLVQGCCVRIWPPQPARRSRGRLRRRWVAGGRPHPYVIR